MKKKKLVSMPLSKGLKKYIVPVTVTYTSYVDVVADDLQTAKKEAEVFVKNSKKKFRKGATFGIRTGKPAVFTDHQAKDGSSLERRTPVHIKNA